jgi:hypothetical protein
VRAEIAHIGRERAREYETGASGDTRSAVPATQVYHGHVQGRKPKTLAVTCWHACMCTQSKHVLSFSIRTCWACDLAGDSSVDDCALSARAQMSAEVHACIAKGGFGECQRTVAVHCKDTTCWPCHLLGEKRQCLAVASTCTSAAHRLPTLPRAGCARLQAMADEDVWPGAGDTGEVPLQLLASQSWDVVPDFGAEERAGCGQTCLAIAHRVHSLLNAEAVPAQQQSTREPSAMIVPQMPPTITDAGRQEAPPLPESPTDADMMEALRLVEEAVAKRSRVEALPPLETPARTVTPEAVPGATGMLETRDLTVPGTEPVRHTSAPCALPPAALKRPTRPLPQPPQARLAAASAPAASSVSSDVSAVAQECYQLSRTALRAATSLEDIAIRASAQQAPSQVSPWQLPPGPMAPHWVSLAFQRPDVPNYIFNEVLDARQQAAWRQVPAPYGALALGAAPFLTACWSSPSAFDDFLQAVQEIVHAAAPHLAHSRAAGAEAVPVPGMAGASSSTTPAAAFPLHPRWPPGRRP